MYMENGVAGRRHSFTVAVDMEYGYPVLSKVDDCATFKKVEVHAKNSTF